MGHVFGIFDMIPHLRLLGCLTTIFDPPEVWLSDFHSVVFSHFPFRPLLYFLFLDGTMAFI
jgi:hypothetical protein